VKGKKKMWGVFLDDICMDNIELALAILLLNELVLELITFEDGDPLEGSLFTPTDADLGLDREEEDDGGEGNGCDGDIDKFGDDMEGDD
jgi:hypothetical protein